MVAGAELLRLWFEKYLETPASAGERLSDRTMKRILVFLKQWALVVAIIAGALGHSVFSHLSFLSPYLLIAMLLFTFCGMSLRTVRIHRLHVMLLAQLHSQRSRF